MFITQQQFNELETRLLNTIGAIKHLSDCMVDEVQPDYNLLKMAGNLQFKWCKNTTLTPRLAQDFTHALGKTTFSDALERGSATFPIYNGNWSIGDMGSVWVDLEVIGNYYRVSLLPDATIYIQKIIDPTFVEQF